MSGVFSRNGRWLSKFRSTYPYVDATPPETNRLRLILGTARSGTSWISQVLFKTTMPCRCFSEPLFHIAPPLPFHKKGDHTAMAYEPVEPKHPLLEAYRLLVQRPFDGSGLPILQRNDSDWELCLIKEVHALLGTEGVLRAWRPPSLLILRDPIFVVDSLFAAQTLQTIYFDHEMTEVRQPAFLKRFVPGREAQVTQLFAEAEKRNERERIILGKALCAQLAQEMFGVLAHEFPCVTLLRYEQFCEKPAETFPAVASFLSIPWDKAMEDYLARTMQADPSLSDPYSVMRNTGEQNARPLKFLSAEEAALCKTVLGQFNSGNAAFRG